MGTYITKRKSKPNNPTKREQKFIQQRFHLRKSDFFGNLGYDTISFDDKEKVDDLLLVKIKKVKVWYNSYGECPNKQSTIVGLLITYVDNKGNIFYAHSALPEKYEAICRTDKISPENSLRESNTTRPGKFYYDFKLNDEEHIKEVVIRYDEVIRSIVFKTNKNSIHPVGYSTKKEYVFKSQDKIITGFFGGYGDNTLDYFGVYYSSVREITHIVQPYFILKKLVKKKFKNERNDVIIGIRTAKKEYDASQTFMKLCQMPDIIFLNVIKYI